MLLLSPRSFFRSFFHQGPSFTPVLAPALVLSSSHMHPATLRRKQPGRRSLAPFPQPHLQLGGTDGLGAPGIHVEGNNNEKRNEKQHRKVAGAALCWRDAPYRLRPRRRPPRLRPPHLDRRRRLAFALDDVLLLEDAPHLRVLPVVLFHQGRDLRELLLEQVGVSGDVRFVETVVGRERAGEKRASVSERVWDQAGEAIPLVNTTIMQRVWEG